MDRSLATFLRSLQTAPTREDAFRLLPTATGLLIRLSNPLNVTLLASQLLSNDVLYPQPIELSACRQIFSVFYTTALRFGREKNKTSTSWEDHHSTLSRSAWVRAVVKGADEGSPRWRHLLGIGGLLLGSEAQEQEPLPRELRTRLEAALATAVNLAIRQQEEPDSRYCVAFVLNHTFPLISDHYRAQLDYDLILPILTDATFFSRQGLEHGYWLSAVDQDVHHLGERSLKWSSRSPSFTRLQDMKGRALISGLGPMARLIAHTLEQVKDAQLVVSAVDQLAAFARNINTSWRHNKLSNVERGDETVLLESETLSITQQFLFQMLRDILFATVIILRAALGRLLCDAKLASDHIAPGLAIQCVHILRNTYFVAHRMGQSSSSQYIFVNFTAIDILNQYPVQAEALLNSLRPAELGQIPTHPLERCHALFFLNTAEHFTLTLPTEVTENLLLAAAMPYIQPSNDPRLGELYEAAHSVVLAVFASPQMSGVGVRHAPVYLETLLKSFPTPLSPRQFRLAVKSLVRVAAPRSAISMSMPLMQEVVLDLMLERASAAPETALPVDLDPAAAANPVLSERAVFVLATIDCLPFLSVELLEQWLPVTAEMIHKLTDLVQKQACHQRFWEVLSSGEMDVPRAAVCVAWWTSRGGRELTLLGQRSDEDDYTMSGGVQHNTKL